MRISLHFEKERRIIKITKSIKPFPFFVPLVDRREGDGMPQDEATKHHYLYYIFKADQAANPMEEAKVHSLRQLLHRRFAPFPKGEEDEHRETE